jgi:hypothetical protein
MAECTGQTVQYDTCNDDSNAEDANAKSVEAELSKHLSD